MKKIVSIMLIIGILSLSACGDEPKNVASNEAQAVKTNEQAKPVKQVKDVNVNSSNMKRSAKADDKIKPIDVDLTRLSSTMVYSEVSQMVGYPEKYVGKTVKMKGQVSIYDSAEMGRTYYTCIIADATACCQQGIEFSLKGDGKLPASCTEGTEVTVIGEFATYMEGDQMYCELKNARLV